MQEDWTEERLLEEAQIILQADSSAKETAGRLYVAMEEEGTSAHLDLPPKLDLSTTMGGLAYPLREGWRIA